MSLEKLKEMILGEYSKDISKLRDNMERLLKTLNSIDRKLDRLIKILERIDKKVSK